MIPSRYLIVVRIRGCKGMFGFGDSEPSVPLCRLSIICKCSTHFMHVGYDLIDSASPTGYLVAGHVRRLVYRLYDLFVSPEIRPICDVLEHLFNGFADIAHGGYMRGDRENCLLQSIASSIGDWFRRSRGPCKTSFLPAVMPL